MHYGITILYCVVYFVFYFHFSPYPQKLNDSEKLWIYSTSPSPIKHITSLIQISSHPNGLNRFGDQWCLEIQGSTVLDTHGRRIVEYYALVPSLTPKGLGLSVANNTVDFLT